ncbi:MAG: hypothetical protein QOI49_2631 [Verrucomicrobiota bacterium]
MFCSPTSKRCRVDANTPILFENSVNVILRPPRLHSTSITKRGRANSPVYWRDCSTLTDDCVLPGPGLCPEIPRDRRHAAIIEVLRKIPEKDYQSIVQQIDSIHRFVPETMSYGEVEAVVGKVEMQFMPGRPVLANRLVYFSPRLEDESDEVIIAVVAHELAHIILNHTLVPASIRKYDAQEKSAFARIRRWGFVKEARAHRQSLSRRGLR